MTDQEPLAIDAGALVVVHCANPKEKLWGMLLRLDAVGLQLRGLDLNSVEDWLRQELSGGDTLIAPSTLFLPTARLERVYLDQSAGPVQSFGDRYRSACGRDVREALAGTSEGWVQ
jgi:hypothetical protein